jgi:hypothetical protein
MAIRFEIENSESRPALKAKLAVGEDGELCLYLDGELVLYVSDDGRLYRPASLPTKLCLTTNCNGQIQLGS